MEEIEKLLARPKAYYNIDGVGELETGFMFLGFALLCWLQVHTPKESIWHQLHGFVLYAGVTFLLLHYGSKAIKERMTYPRTGLVQYRDGAPWLGFMPGMVVAVAASRLAIPGSREGSTTLALLLGLLFTGAYAYGLARVVRWKWTVVAAMVLVSLATASFPATALGAFWNTMALYGILLVISGAATFVLYLKRTRAAQ